MSDPYGPFPEWDAEATYSAGDRISFGGYLYEAMTAISAGDNPRTATFTATLTDSALSGSSTTATLRKWRVWDYPAAYYMARLRGLPDSAILPGLDKNGLPEEIRTVVVRSNYQFIGTPDTDLYDQPASASYSGYGMPAGMDTNWDDPEEGELMWSFSAARYEDGAPYAYDYNLGAASGICYQPTTICPEVVYPVTVGGTDYYGFLPAWQNETQGQAISCYQTFSRTFDYLDEFNLSDTVTTNGFEDNWRANPEATNNENAIGPTIGTDPDYSAT